MHVPGAYFAVLNLARAHIVVLFLLPSLAVETFLRHQKPVLETPLERKVTADREILLQEQKIHRFNIKTKSSQMLHSLDLIVQ